MTRYLGGLITKDESLVIPANNFENTSAPGVWTLEEAQMLAKQGKWPTAGNALTRAYWFARTTTPNVHYSDITTLGNTTDWGYSMRDDRANYNCGTTSSATRAVQSGYEASASQARSSNIEQMELASAGAGTNFGDLSVSSSQSSFGCGNGTRGLLTQGFNNSYAYTTAIDYVTIASAGNGTDYGDLTVARGSGSGSFNSTTRGGFVGGNTNGVAFTNTIDYVTIASTGNATDFGDTLAALNGAAGCSNSTRAIIASGDVSGSAQQNVIQYFTIASTGNATDFGDLTGGGRYGAAGCSSTRALIAADFVGNSSGIDYITIASTGNGTDFGDLLNNEVAGISCASTAHGGLG